MLCCAICGTGVGRGENTAECFRGVMYQVWGPQEGGGVIPPQFRVSWRYRLDDHYDAMSHGRRGFEDFRAVCCACHLLLSLDTFHLVNRTEFMVTSCSNCRTAVDGGFRNVRHRKRAVKEEEEH